MEQTDMQSTRLLMLGEARALQAAFPNTDAMRDLPVSAVPQPSTDEGETARTYRAALGYLRDEMLLVRAGKADSLTVLNDEIAFVESLLPCE